MLQINAERQEQRLVTSRLLLSTARASQTAVAALNFYNAETLLAHVRAANALQASDHSTNHRVDYRLPRPSTDRCDGARSCRANGKASRIASGSRRKLSNLLRVASKPVTPPSCLTVPSFRSAKTVAQTRRVVELAHAYGVSVEGELGHVAHNDETAADDIKSFYTRPEDALRFVEETGVDALAIAIGTAHGFYKGEVRLDFERLDRIREAVGDRVALVLHGGSGVPEELLRRAVAHGISED